MRKALNQKNEEKKTNMKKILKQKENMKKKANMGKILNKKRM